jgi:hypothetical protein
VGAALVVVVRSFAAEADENYRVYMVQQNMQIQKHCQALPPHSFNVSIVILGFIHAQLYSMMMDARHPKHVGGLTTVCYVF